MKRKKYITTNDPTIEIIATARAKKRAAQKLKIPFSNGDEIASFGLIEENEYHIHVDLSQLHGYDKHQYYKLMKKYYKKELENFTNPHKFKLSMIIFSSLVAGIGLLVYHTPSNQQEERNFAEPKLIQQAKTPVAQEKKENIRQ